LVEYDDVINKHREVIYRRRNKILGAKNNQQELKKIILEYIKEEISDVVKFHTQAEIETTWNLEEIYEVMDTIFPVSLEVRVKLEEIKDKKQELRIKNQGIENGVRGQIIDYLYNLAEKEYEKLENNINGDETLKTQLKAGEQNAMQVIEKMILLRSIDALWVEHIDAMDHMRRGIGLRSYGQKDPLVEYKKEAHQMFQDLLANIRKQVVYSIFKIGMSPVNNQSREGSLSGQPIASNQQMNFSGPAKTGAISSSAKPVDKISGKKVGRNDPCPCGSGKKYKKCCGR